MWILSDDFYDEHGAASLTDLARAEQEAMLMEEYYKDWLAYRLGPNWDKEPNLEPSERVHWAQEGF